MPHHPPSLVALAALGGAALGPPVDGALGTASGWAGRVLLIAGVVLAFWGWQRQVVAWVVVATALLAIALSVRALDPLDDLEPGPVRGTVVLRSDPRRYFGSIEVVVADGDRRLLAGIDGPAAGEIAGLQLGDSMRVTGRTRRFVQPTGWHRSRHLVGELQVDSVDSIKLGSGAYALAAGVRERISASVEPLSHDSRALVLGAALGDDRAQSDAQRDRFLRSGLTHLLVVSGQNVALMLVLCAPLLSRVPVARRPWAIGAVVGWFVLVVRPDPSVLRAGAAALVAALASRRGQLVKGPTVLAGALTAVVLVDPLVIGSLGFWLSAAATLGLVVGLGSARSEGRRASDWNPAAVARATLAAQIGVAPVLACAGLAVPVASLPANVAAGAPAGLITGWGMTIGLVAASLPGPLATLARQPVVAAAWWVDGVARWSARLPLGRFTPGETFVVLGAAVLTWVVWRRPPIRRRWLALMPLTVLICWTAWPRAITSVEVPGGCLLANDGSTVLMLHSAPPTRRLLGALAESEVRSIDRLVVAPGGLRLAETVVAVRDAVPVREVVSMGEASSLDDTPVTRCLSPDQG